MTYSTLIRGGTVIDTEPVPTVLGTADVLVEDDRIAAIGPDLPAPGPDTEVIDAAGRIVLPGFVDTHRHTWQAGIRASLPDGTLADYISLVIGDLTARHTPEDVYTGVLAGALECLDAGITTLVDWAHIQLTPEHTDANIEALRAAGIRAVLGYCYGGDGGPDALAAEARRVRDACDGGPAMALAAHGPEFGDEDRALTEWRTARDLDIPLTVHMGTAGTESAERGLAFLRRHDLLAHPTTYVHANWFGDDAFKLLADHGATVSVSPGVEAALAMGQPPTGRSRAAGVPTGLSADTVVSGSGDMFSVMRAAYTLERGRPDGAGLGFTAADTLRTATLEGAEVAGLAGVTGSLRPGKQADVVVLRTDLLGMAGAHDPIAAAVRSADPRTVETVLVGGRIAKRDGVLCHPDLPRVLEAVNATATRLGRR